MTAAVEPAGAAGRQVASLRTGESECRQQEQLVVTGHWRAMVK